MIAPPPPEESLFAFLRRWAWPFEPQDSDVAQTGDPFHRWTREDGLLDGQILVFRFDDTMLELAADAERPERRLSLSPETVDALHAPLTAYLEGDLAFEAFSKAGPGAAAVLALYFEAQAEARAVSPDDVGDD